MVFYDSTISIFKVWRDETLFRTYCILYTKINNPVYRFEINKPLLGKDICKKARLATEEEKQKLFKEIEKNGYRWNEEKKCLLKLPEFKDGDVITYKYEQGLVSMILSKFVNFTEVHCHCALYNNTKGFITDSYIVGEPKYANYATEGEKEKLFNAIKENGYRWNAETKTLERLIVPKFKVGDRIKHKSSNLYCTLKEYSEGISAYRTNIGLAITYKDLEQWELAPDKFNISTLKPFDKVLGRSTTDGIWRCDFLFNIKENGIYKYECIAYCYKYCIPYKGNEHLRGTTDDCSEYYKIWED